MPTPDRLPRRWHAALAWGGAALFAASLTWFVVCYLVRFDRLAPVRPAALAIGLDVALFSAFALHHSVFARTLVKSAVRARVPPVLERSLYTWIASALFLAVCTAWRGVPGELWHLRGPLRLAGWGVQLAGLVLTVAGSARLDVLDLAGVRQVQRAGRGPALESAHVALETGGLYGFVRHPIYFAWVLFVFGAPEMTATRFTFAAVSTMYLMLAVPLEERGLRETFGAAYASYQRRVRWRMIPGIY